jgi:hypothetical protein
MQVVLLSMHFVVRHATVHQMCYGWWSNNHSECWGVCICMTMNTVFVTWIQAWIHRFSQLLDALISARNLKNVAPDVVRYP